jgi:hypothetical protein
MPTLFPKRRGGAWIPDDKQKGALILDEPT